MQTIYFVTNNEKKFEEAKSVLDDIQQSVDEEKKWNLVHKKENIPEIQTAKVGELIRNKALSAFKLLKRPVLVEQTSLKIDAMGGLPGLQSAYILSSGHLDFRNEALEDIVSFCNMKKVYSASAETNYCLCDGKKYFYGTGTVSGTIKEEFDKSPDCFGWDSIFSPGTENFTYSENPSYKWQNSMRREALKNLYETAGIEKFFVPSTEEKDNENHIKELAVLLKERKVMLFIGAGISASVGLPSWNKLIEELGAKLGFQEGIFQTYGDSMMLAEYMMAQNENVTISHLEQRFEIKEGDQEHEELKVKKIYHFIDELDVPVIYTTNFDNLLEKYCDIVGKPYHVCKEISDIQKSDQNTLRIMKFHGDVSQIKNMKDIVLTESQYYRRMRFDSFIDIQLQADLQKYNVLFLGYSLSDINVKLLMYMARNRWKNGENNMPKTYIFTATPNYVQKEVFLQNGIISISNDETDKYESTLQFLNKLSCYRQNLSDELF